MSVGFQTRVPLNHVQTVVSTSDGSRADTFGFGDTPAADQPAPGAKKRDSLDARRHVWGRYRTPTMSDAIAKTANIGWTTLIWANEWPDDSIYGLAVGVNLLHNTGQKKLMSDSKHHMRAVIFENMLVYFPYWLLLYANIFAQLAIVWFLRRIALGTDGTCSHTSYVLQLICSMVYTAKIWVDLWQSFKMIMYIRWLPLLRKGATWRLGITQVVLDEDDEIIDFCRDDPTLPDDKCEGHGIYRRTRYLLYTFVIFPKAFIAIVLWWYGLYFLVTSENDSELLLNAVALLFVLDIDEYVGELVPESTREQVSQFPQYKLSAKDFFAEFTPMPGDPSKNVLGNKLRNKDLWCAWANLRDPVFFWSTYGHWIPPIFMMLGIAVASQIICADYNSA